VLKQLDFIQLTLPGRPGFIVSPPLAGYQLMVPTPVQRLAIFLVVALPLFFAGCSFGTDYVIVNSSGAPLQVTYTIAPTSIDPLAAIGVNIPAMLPASQLSGRREWRKLSQTEFGFDRTTRTVTVSLPPNQGLLITRGSEFNPNHRVPERFIILEIRIDAPSGEMVLKGDAVPKAFVVEPKPFYRFGPPTLLKLTYT
jgi:hypothetical protein